MAAAVICSIVGVLVVCAVIVAIVIFVLKKRQPEIYEVKRRPDRMDNPVYTGMILIASYPGFPHTFTTASLGLRLQL